MKFLRLTFTFLHYTYLGFSIQIRVPPVDDVAVHSLFPRFVKSHVFKISYTNYVNPPWNRSCSWQNLHVNRPIADPLSLRFRLLFQKQLSLFAPLVDLVKAINLSTASSLLLVLQPTKWRFLVAHIWALECPQGFCIRVYLKAILMAIRSTGQCQCFVCISLMPTLPFTSVFNSSSAFREKLPYHLRIFST